MSNTDLALDATVADQLLQRATIDSGAQLRGWKLEHMDVHPGVQATATYLVELTRGSRPVRTRFGITRRAGGPTRSDSLADVYQDGRNTVAIWEYPEDPDLPALAIAANGRELARALIQYGVLPKRADPTQLQVELTSYRPRRRAVFRAWWDEDLWYVKVLRPESLTATRDRHRMLLDAGIPAPEVLVAARSGLLVMPQLPGRPLADAIFDPKPPISAESLIELLDSVPAGVSSLPRRPPWASGVEHFANQIARTMPALENKLNWLTDDILSGLANSPVGNEPTHGDFHEGQIRIARRRVTGLLDIETLGPGSRVDDLACLVAHLACVQNMNDAQHERIAELLRQWVPVFDERVDSIELRLRAAAVVVSLATGPYRANEPDWQAETRHLIDTAIALVRQVR